MNLADVTPNEEQIAELGRRYVAGVQDRHADTLRRAVRYANRGLKIIDMIETLRLGGWKEDGSGPGLALAPINEDFAHFEVNSRRVRWWWRNGAWDHAPMSHFDVSPPWNDGQWQRGQAAVPNVPTAYIPKSMRGLFVLWEAEWTPEPTRDPYLLKRLGRSVFAVLAGWNLTALERAVLR